MRIARHCRRLLPAIALALAWLAPSVAPAQALLGGIGLVDPRVTDLSRDPAITNVDGRTVWVGGMDAPLLRGTLVFGAELQMHDRNLRQRVIDGASTGGERVLQFSAVEIPLSAKFNAVSEHGKAYVMAGLAISAAFRCEVEVTRTALPRSLCSDNRTQNVEESRMPLLVGVGGEWRPVGAVANALKQSRFGAGIGVDVRYTPRIIADLVPGGATAVRRVGQVMLNVRLGAGR